MKKHKNWIIGLSLGVLFFYVLLMAKEPVVNLSQATIENAAEENQTESFVKEIEVESFNEESLNTFETELKKSLRNVETKTPFSLKITSHTIEGDPIVQIIDYDGAKIKYIFDNSKDTFGGEDKGRTETEYDSLIYKKKNQNAGESEVETVYDAYVLIGEKEEVLFAR